MALPGALSHRTYLTPRWASVPSGSQIHGPGSHQNVCFRIMPCSSSHVFLASAVLPFPASTTAGGNSKTRANRRGFGMAQPPQLPQGPQWVGCYRQGMETGAGDTFLREGVWSGSRRQNHRGGVCGLPRRRDARVNSRGGHRTTWGLTLAWRREAHGLGEGGQHRLLCQPEAQPSTQGSGRESG